jgi:hypothetical protein
MILRGYWPAHFIHPGSNKEVVPVLISRQKDTLRSRRMGWCVFFQVVRRCRGFWLTLFFQWPVAFWCRSVSDTKVIILSRLTVVK